MTDPRRRFLTRKANSTMTPYPSRGGEKIRTVECFIPLGRMGQDVQIGSAMTHSDAQMLPMTKEDNEIAVRVMSIQSDVREVIGIPELEQTLDPGLFSREVLYTCRIVPGRLELMDVVFRFGLTSISVTCESKSVRRDFEHPVVNGT